MSFPDRIFFEVAFPSAPDSVADLWRTLCSFLNGRECLPATFEVSQVAGHSVEFHTTERLTLDSVGVANLIEERKLNGFHVTARISPRATLSFSLDDGKQVGEQMTLRCRMDSSVKAPDDWSVLISGIMTLSPSIGGWQWHSRYEAWQNVKNLHSSYTTFYGEVPAGVRRTVKKSIDGIGPDNIVIDVSTNPGRLRELIPWIIYFHPTAEMWLGPHFWQYAKCTKEEVLAAEFFLEKRDTPHFLYLKSWHQPFTRPDGEQGRQQQRLWKLFFEEDCEWPPGSGGICDEPMYGPPELMPPAE